MDSPLYPLRFKPIFKRHIWGGRRLGTLLGKGIGPEPDFAESWEISDHGRDVSRVVEGPLAGVSLRDLIEAKPNELLGNAFVGMRQFPLLVKFLDANQPLSVQVHPNDEQGRRLVNDNGKTEAWYILDAAPASRIYAGLQRGVDRESLLSGIKSGGVESLLHSFEAKAGQCVFIPAGTVHAIGAGILLAEVQQMSDATFRVYDWGRVGDDGVPRALHIEEALASTDFTRGPVDPVEPGPAEQSRLGERQLLVKSPYFEIVHHQQSAGGRLDLDGTFRILIMLSGESQVTCSDWQGVARPYETWLLPARCGSCEIVPSSRAGASYLAIRVPLQSS
jgi:mannose-6-phosphate isomerase